MERSSHPELDNPVWWALTGTQRHLGTTGPFAARFDPEVSPFGALSDEPTEAHWEDLSTLAGPGGMVALINPEGRDLRLGTGWTVEWQLRGVQMVGDRVASGRGPSPGSDPRVASDPTPQPLGADDVADMLALVAVARPGPFLVRTVEFGGYLGVGSEGRLVAMAGERLRPAGYAEVSAVATAPSHRRQGLAGRLVGAVAAAIIERDETPFLHAAATNTDAIRLYESMGFLTRSQPEFVLLRAPGADGPSPSVAGPRPAPRR